VSGSVTGEHGNPKA